MNHDILCISTSKITSNPFGSDFVHVNPSILLQMWRCVKPNHRILDILRLDKPGILGGAVLFQDCMETFEKLPLEARLHGGR